MSFLALPYAERERKASLSEQYDVSGIPTLVLLDGATGEIITKEGREAVSTDPEGYPWRPKPLSALLGSSFVDSAGAPASIPADTTHVALYHSAHWCPPCKRFTPELVARVGSMPSAPGARLVVIFVSSDSDEASFTGYLASMTGFMAIPFADKKRRNALGTACGVSGIPSLTLCSYPEVTILNPAARGVISNDFPAGWLPHAVPDVNSDDAAVDALNSMPCLICLAEGAPAEAQAAARAALASLRPDTKPKDLFLGIAMASEGVSSSIRRLCSLGEPTAVPQLLVLNLNEDGSFYMVPPPAEGGSVVCDGDSCAMVRPGEVTPGSVKAAVAAWKAGTLKKQHVSGSGGEAEEEMDEEGEGGGGVSGAAMAHA